VEWLGSELAGWWSPLAATERGVLTGVGVPRWCKSSSGERWWWSRGAARCTGKIVEGSAEVGAELEAVTGSSKGDRGRHYVVAQ
jgi:hypothetical protein